jgi:hypothetical protein
LAHRDASGDGASVTRTVTRGREAATITGQRGWRPPIAISASVALSAVRSVGTTTVTVTVTVTVAVVFAVVEATASRTRPSEVAAIVLAARRRQATLWRRRRAAKLATVGVEGPAGGLAARRRLGRQVRVGKVA